MELRTILLCFLCGQPQDLVISLFPDASLGSPRFWCRRCCAPRTLSKRLKELMADDEARFAGGDGEMLRQLIFAEQAVEQDRAESLAA